MVDFGKDCNASPFVCPNDRQLALRAKLKTGWSVKTNLKYSNSSSNQSLEPEETSAILNVIKRAEELDLNEQERVGCLIERLETMRRNVLGRNPNQCLLCGETFGILGAQKVICMDCQRPVCQKCAIDSLNNRHAFSKDHWLCMICAETREIWKKSGAWFFKSIPKYILPGETSSLKRRPSKKPKRGKSFLEDDSSSDEDWKSRNFRIHRRRSSTESSQDYYRLDQNYYHTVGTYSRQTSSSDSHGSNKDMENLKPYPSFSTLNESTKSLIDEAGPSKPIDCKKSELNSDLSEAARRESLLSRSFTESNWSEPMSRSDDRKSPSVASIGSSIFRNPIDDMKNLDLSMGTMDLSLTYDPLNSTLHCTVFRAKNLIPMDINGLSDPYCKLNILPNSKTSTRLRTKTVHKTRNPEFNENLTFYDTSEEDLVTKSLHILVVDDDKFGHDFMGETKINLAKLKVQNTMYLTVPLNTMPPAPKGPLPAPELCQWFDDLCSRGQILLSLCYSTKKRSLLVTVVRCANLLPMDNNGFSDPFVKLQLKPDPNHKKHKTSIKWKDLNPTYNEEFGFETRPTELSTQSLYITVFDYDYGKSNDYLGGLVLGGIGSKGQRLKQWLDMIRYPDHHHECWHNLTEEILK